MTLTQQRGDETQRSSFDVVDPATGSIIGQAPEATPEQLDAAMLAAATAFPSWSASREQRSAALNALAAQVEEHAAELARLTTLEQGKPLAEAMAEVIGSAMIIRFCAGVEVASEVIHDDAQARVQLRHRPIGPVVAITPWNGPIYMLAMKVGPALAAGNTVVAKPSPVTPLATLRFGELASAVLPDGVLRVLTGSGDLGAWMVSHPLTQKVTFTGSIATGRRVAMAAASDLKRITLELGGNDPAIVLPDADIHFSATKLAQMSFGNAGQVCVAPKRIYVHESIHDEFSEALAAAAAALHVGHGLDEGVEMGPLTTPEQRSFVEELIAEARDRGATVVTGGHRLGDVGNFLEPTVLTGVPDVARVVAEEQFGPVIPLLSYQQVDDAVRRANDTHYGLGASVWGRDPEALAAVSNRLDAGQVWVNTHREVATPAQPVVGVKWSGLGAENGRIGVLDFTAPQMYFEAKVRSDQGGGA